MPLVDAEMIDRAADKKSPELRLAAKLRSLRAERDITQQQLADIANQKGVIRFTQKRISTIETTGSLSATELMQLAKAFNRPIQEFEV